mmetsp:Transcript_10623/g.25410  ORF Transcript_10623/g.25410 Transcript_10623/m.25410 type:complete len:250 (+) Transcript_10623:68-817(+)
MQPKSSLLRPSLKLGRNPFKRLGALWLRAFLTGLGRRLNIHELVILLIRGRVSEDNDAEIALLFRVDGAVAVGRVRRDKCVLCVGHTRWVAQHKAVRFGLFLFFLFFCFLLLLVAVPFPRGIRHLGVPILIGGILVLVRLVSSRRCTLRAGLLELGFGFGLGGRRKDGRGDSLLLLLFFLLEGSRVGKETRLCTARHLELARNLHVLRDADDSGGGKGEREKLQQRVPVPVVQPAHHSYDGALTEKPGA